MVFLFVGFLVVVTLLWVIQEKNIYNPSTIFAAMWALVMLLSGIRLNGLVATSNRAYILAFVGVLMFVAGCMFRDNIKICFSKRQRRKAGNYEINYNLLMVLYGFVLVFTTYLASKSIPLILGGVPMKVIRQNYRNVEEGIVISTRLFYSVEIYLVQATEFAAAALLPILITAKKSFKNIVVTLELMLFLTLHIFVTGARSFLLDVVILSFFYILINNSLIDDFRDYFRKIPKIIIVLIGVGAIAMIVFVTQLRKGEDLTMMEETYQYFAIAFPLFDIKLGIMDNTREYTYGLTALNGLLRPVFLALRTIGMDFPKAYARATQLIDDNNIFYYVGSGRGNSFVTVFYYFYMDFGVTGVITGSFIYGYICEAYYRRMLENPNRKNQTLYLLIIIGEVLSFVRLFFSALRYVYSFLVIAIAYKRETGEGLNAEDVN